MNLRSVFTAAALTGALLPAFAAVEGGSATLCSDSLMPWLNGGYVDCAGPLAGSIGFGQVDLVSFSGFGSFRLAGLSNDATGTFAANPGAVDFGTLDLGSAQHGAFVIGVQGGNTYSLYLFDSGRSGVSTLTFDTYGVVGAGGLPGPSLSHASLFVASAVPEPGSAAMLAAGLAAVSLLRRRRAN